MRLAEVQRCLRQALLSECPRLPDGLLVGGTVPPRRFEIHRRHFEHSLTMAVTGRFPATEWLIGGARLDAAARDFVRANPPASPCIADYGDAFPAFLARWPTTAPLRYLPAFAELDWHLGRLAVSVDRVPAGLERLRAVRGDELADLGVALQPGLHYLRSDWDVDALIQHYLTDSAPPEWTLTQGALHLEVRGARGAFHFARLSAGDFAFRASLAAGTSCGDAAAAALERDSGFDPGAALVALAGEGLIVDLSAIGTPHS